MTPAFCVESFVVPLGWFLHCRNFLCFVEICKNKIIINGVILISLENIDFLDSAYNSIIMCYIEFYIVFILIEIYVRVTLTCYKPFAWNVIMNIGNICFLSLFLSQTYPSRLTESINALYAVLIAHFVRSLINELLSRYFIQKQNRDSNMT